MSSLRVIISGGGTGGHIFPAIAIAHAVKAKRPDAEFLFVGAKGRMEMEKVPAAGYKIEALWISGLQRSLSLRNLMFPVKLISSLWRARSIVRTFKPHVAVGTGGFASGPTLRAATSKGIPALIQEQNSFPGITNRLLGKRVQRVCVAYEGMEKYFAKNKLLLTGNPVRKDVVNIEGKRNEALEAFGLDPDRTTVLIIGGSLGARSVNRAMEAGLQKLAEAGVQLVWQTGKPSYEQAQEAVKAFPEATFVVREFIGRMDLAYAAADLVISRAGAIAVSELCLVQKPCILVPFPHAAEDHQTKNAQALVNRGAARMIADAEVDNTLVDTCLELLNDADARQKLIAQLSGLGMADSADRIAEEVIKLAEA